MKTELIKKDALGDDSGLYSLSNHQLYLTYNRQLKNGWMRNASTKNRSMVSGGGRKPYKQKGTGRARRGTQRSPLIVGGGVIFGPQPHFKSYKVNKKQVRHTIMSYFSSVISSGNATVLVDDFDSEIPKTKDARAVFNSSEQYVLFLTMDDFNLFSGVRNLPNIKVTFVDLFSFQEVMGISNYCFSRAALKLIQSEFEHE